MKQDTGIVKVWVSDLGAYEIPKDVLSKSRLRKDGYIDRRSPNVELKGWIKKMDSLAERK